MSRLISFLFLVCFLQSNAQDGTRLLRSPAISADHIAFVYSNDLWICDKQGENVKRLTTFQGAETSPHFSPDGQWIAFSAQYDGNQDVYVLPISGGEPKRMTWHPGGDIVKGWTNDGASILFASGRANAPISIPDQLWTVDVADGSVSRFALPRAWDGAFSPNGKHFAYQEVYPWESEWRNYRGGQTRPIKIADLKSLAVTDVPWNGSNDIAPVWEGDKVYYLSDQDLIMNIWSYDPDSKSIAQVTKFEEMDCKALASGDGQLIFENSGYLYTMGVGDTKPQRLAIDVAGDFSWARPHWEDVDKSIRNAAISPTGKRAVFEARGEIFTVPAENGDVRNLTNSSGSAERSPAWSPDGKWISWFSDMSGEYQLVIADQFGKVSKEIGIEGATFFYSPRWSPDSKKLSFTDADRNIYILDVDSGSWSIVDDEGFAHPVRTIFPEWSPDSKWLAYTKRLTNEYNAIFIHSLESGESTQLTDGMSDCVMPAWDASGKYIYFLGSTDYGMNVGWLDMSSLERPLRRSIYMAVLDSEEASPLAPKSDDEEVEEEEEKSDDEEGDVADAEESGEGDSEGEEEDEIVVKIDFENILYRVISLDVPSRSYQTLFTGEEGVVFYTESIENQPGLTLHKYSIEDRESTKLMDGLSGAYCSFDRKKLFYEARGSKWGITDASSKPESGAGALDMSDMKMLVDPKAEWAQILDEAIRFQRDYFYVENVHGLDLDWARNTYTPWLEDVRHRSDLTYLLDIVGGETAIGHSFTGGGDLPDVDRVPVGLLGADYSVEDGGYKIEKIYTGENWNPNLRAPLTGPGIDIKEGEFIVAVNGVPITSDVNIYSYFDQTAGKQTKIMVNSSNSMEGAREVTVVPVSSESQLRQYDWVEGNRRKVDEMSGGKLAYVWLPNTAGAGYRNFNRYYFAQKDKKGAVIDERFNGGGFIADYIVDLLSRDLYGFFNNPIGNKQPFTAPNAALWGPKVMLVNEMAGSGGDMLPHMFQMKGIGPVIGTRTWGGLVGIWDVPQLLDGGYITAPRGGYYNLEGEWDVENEGVTPDIEVHQDPAKVAAGHDPQLEKAVEVALELLGEEEVKILPQPADPVRAKRPGKS